MKNYAINNGITNGNKDRVFYVSFGKPQCQLCCAVMSACPFPVSPCNIVLQFGREASCATGETRYHQATVWTLKLNFKHSIHIGIWNVRTLT